MEAEVEMEEKLAKQKAYNKEYFAKNKERVIAKRKKTRAQNPEKARERNRRHYQKNRAAIMDYQKRYRSENKKKRTESHRRSHLKINFGISLEEYEDLLKKQNDVCAICRNKNPVEKSRKANSLAVDHCHVTEHVRGLLCTPCNIAIGLMNDSIEFLSSAIDYLKSHSSNEAAVKL